MFKITNINVTRKTERQARDCPSFC